MKDMNQGKKKGFWAFLFGKKSDSHCAGQPQKSYLHRPTEPSTSCCCCGKDVSKADDAARDTAPTAAGNVAEIKILGPGCAKCKSAYGVIERVIRDNHLDIKLTKVEEITEILAYNIIGTPAIVVDEVVKIKGRVPTEKEVCALLGI